MNNGITKGWPVRAQVQPQVACALPLKTEKDKYI